ncbi:hypothetical protein SCLCIDRAFT_1222749 [Scleroderma citrinum Foug A]|uniref:Uncharacterized protein n=1 Tax=Scleroderma citrinum Foug A TaxID=1036808 RepID=A0A0C3CY64_9AGAM|nr:hypothetical protein SCLCIDRAFT_1222749 [Scleroderma citrinum Foug A]
MDPPALHSLHTLLIPHYLHIAPLATGPPFWDESVRQSGPSTMRFLATHMDFLGQYYTVHARTLQAKHNVHSYAFTLDPSLFL